MSKPLGSVITENTISMIHNGKPISIKSSHSNFEAIKEILLVTKEYDKLENLYDNISNIKQKTKSISENLVITDNEEILYKGFKIPNVLQEKLLNDIEQGYDVQGFALFIENLMENPSSTAIQELYLFIQSGEFPITDDGHFLAYKKVRSDYRDVYTGTFDNSVGKILEMPRNFVDDNRDNTCSYGFHFCSYSYLFDFRGDRVMILKINPKDVVSIPSDYNNTKGRTCRYEVLSEVESWKEDDFLKENNEYRSFYVEKVNQSDYVKSEINEEKDNQMNSIIDNQKQQDLVQKLISNVVEIDFTKKNGEQRTILGTLSQEYVTQEEARKATHGDSVSVWDIEKKAWRSFTVSNVNSYKVVETI